MTDLKTIVINVDEFYSGLIYQSICYFLG